MSRPWMPLYIADFVADTLHLSAAQVGAYTLLIGHYWQHGNLPDDEAVIARIARLPTVEWRRSRPALAALFQDGWKHKRIDAELARAAEISSKRAASAKQKHSNSSANAPPNAEQLDTHARASPQLQSQREDAASPPSNPEKELFERGKQVLGKGAGGLVAKLLKAKNGSAALARAVIEQASEKQDPREYVAKILNGADVVREGEFVWKSGIPGVL